MHVSKHQAPRMGLYSSAKAPLLRKKCTPAPGQTSPQTSDPSSDSCSHHLACASLNNRSGVFAMRTQY